MQLRSILRLLLPLLLIAPLRLAADDVYLTNGKTFEGVIAEVSETSVRIRMPGGEISLPRSQVLRVEKQDSGFAEYLRRKQALGAGAPAAAWLDLARWARANELEQGAREAALRAAEIDPSLPGLGKVLRGMGYVLDEQAGRWMPYAESMRRRGFVLADGEWITREEHRELVRAREEELARHRAEREAASAARRAELVLQIAETQLYREAIRATAPVYPVGPVTYGYGFPLVVIPGFIVDPHPAPHDPGTPRHVPGQLPQGRSGSGRLLHVPGSLLPNDSARSSGH
jgi:DNA-binding transcriptional ArsR family regulator